ncbi:MAG TPA: PH domain-containing protein [Phycisphaerales bacterium]|nr:PH domain-containing protein [Phycisphaerales bacterium]
MISLSCDRCQRTIKVGPELAGQRVACPDCGDVNIVPIVGPATTAAPGTRTGAPSSAAPTAPDRASVLGLPPDSGPEQPVLKVHAALFRARPLSCAVLALLAIGALVGAALLAARGQDRVWAIACGAAALIPLAVLCIWKVRTLDQTLEITNKRVVARRGLLSRATSEVGHEHIRNVQIDQSFWQRLWGVGTVGISSAGQSDIEISLPDIPRPLRVKEIIDAYRDTLD